MLLWLMFVLMTAAAILAVLWPLSRQRIVAAGGNDVVVYRDQLEEISRDRAAGLIGEQEAEAARVEVSRRLLAAADAAEPAPSSGSTARRRAVAVTGLVFVPVLATVLYLVLGSPSLPSAQHDARAQAPENRSLQSLVSQVETHIERNPNDGRGWEVLAPVYLRLGRFDDAVKARRNVLRIGGQSADRQADLGEALVGSANGIVTAEAKDAFERAIALDPQSVKGRYFLGLAAEQDGRRDDAAKIWRELMAGAPADAPWLPFVRGELARLAGGPSADDVAAASNLPSDARMTMIRGMVEKLSDRLHHDGAADLDGWQRLVRSYMVLGEQAKARAAASDARRALAQDPDKLQRFDEQVKGMGLEG